MCFQKYLTACVILVLTAVARAQTDAVPAAEPARPALTLETALRLALSNDNRIAIARGDEKISGLDYRQSKHAFGPSLSLEGDYARNEGGDPADPFTSKFNPKEQWNGWFRVSQTLLDARLFPEKRRQQALWSASANDYTNTIRTRLFIVATAFYRAIQSQMIQSVAEQSKQLADLETERAQLRVKAGEARQTDLLRAQVDQSGAERALNEAHNDVVVAARALFRLVGLPVESTLSIQPPAPTPEPGNESLADLIKLGADHRSDIAAARHRIEAAENEERVARYDSLPKINIAFEEVLANPDVYEKGRDTWDIVIAAKMSLWDKGERSTKRRQQLLRVEQSRHELAQAEKDAAGETDRSLAALGIARLNYQTAQKEEQFAIQNYLLLSEQAKNGLATALDVSTALVDLTRARMDTARLQYEVEIAKLALQAALGQFPIPLEK